LAGIASVTAGRWTRPTSRSPAGGATCTERSTSSGRSSTCWSLGSGRQRRPAVLPAGDQHDQGHARRGHHRQGAVPPAALEELLPAAGVSSERCNWWWIELLPSLADAAVEGDV